MLGELVTGDATDGVLDRFQRMAQNNQRAITPERSVYAHHIMTIAFPEDGRADIRECVVDDLRVVQDVQGTDEPMTVVVDDETVTVEVTTALRRYDTGWRITGRDMTDVLEGVRDCGTCSP